MTLQESIIQFFVDKGLVQGYGVDSFSDTVPAEPDDIVCLYEYGGDPLNPYAGFINRSMQVIVRNTNPDNAKTLSWSLYKALVATTENLLIQFTEDEAGQVYLRDTPAKLKEDENGRIYYCFNIGITISF